MKLPLVLFGFLLSSHAFSRDADFTEASTKVKRFIEDVVYVVEVGDREAFSKRWLTTPRLVVNSSDAGLKAFAEGTFAEICGEAKLPPADTAAMTIYIGGIKELTEIAEKKERKINLGRGHSYWTWWDGERRNINEAVVFLCTDRLTGPAAQDALLEDLLGAFGFPARSREFEETCLATKPSVMTKLSALDRKLLSFYHAYVPPGTRKDDLRKLIEAQWR